MTPAASHRIAERGEVSRRMIDRTSRPITAGLVPLMLGPALDICVVCVAAVDSAPLGLAAAAAAVLVVFTASRFVFPARRRRERHRDRPGDHPARMH